MKLATFLALSVVFGLLCITHAAPEQKRDVARMRDLIKAECVGARAQDDDDDDCDDDQEIDEALAQFFTKVLEERAKIEGNEVADKLAESEGFRSFVRKVKSKAKSLFKKAKSKLSSKFKKLKHKVKTLLGELKSKLPKLVKKGKKLFEHVKSKLSPKLLNKVKTLLDKVESK